MLQTRYIFNFGPNLVLDDDFEREGRREMYKKEKKNVLNQKRMTKRKVLKFFNLC